jgi:hypothetical protein
MPSAKPLGGVWSAFRIQPELVQAVWRLVVAISHVEWELQVFKICSHEKDQASTLLFSPLFWFDATFASWPVQSNRI